jgi:hypothetical protein
MRHCERSEAISLHLRMHMRRRFLWPSASSHDAIRFIRLARLTLPNSGRPAFSGGSRFALICAHDAEREQVMMPLLIRACSPARAPHIEIIGLFGFVRPCIFLQISGAYRESAGTDGVANPGAPRCANRCHCERQRSNLRPRMRPWHGLLPPSLFRLRSTSYGGQVELRRTGRASADGSPRYALLAMTIYEP